MLFSTSFYRLFWNLRCRRYGIGCSGSSLKNRTFSASKAENTDTVDEESALLDEGNATESETDDLDLVTAGIFEDIVGLKTDIKGFSNFKQRLSGNTDETSHQLVDSSGLTPASWLQPSVGQRGHKGILREPFSSLRDAAHGKHADTGRHSPIKQHPRRLPFAKQEEVQNLIKDMEDNDVIEPSSSPWASLIVLVRKKDGSTRFCADYRRSQKRVLAVELHPDDKEKTAFTTGQGLRQFKVMPFGVCNAPATSERLMETVLGGLSYEACLVYLDDIIIVGRSFEEYLKNIRRVQQKLKEANLKLSPSKGYLFRREVTYLGHIISEERVQRDPDNISAVKDWNCPKDVHQLWSFLDLCMYYRKLVKNFSAITIPLHKLIEEYDVEIRHRNGSAHGNADALSKRPCPENCKYCSKIEKKFGVRDPIFRRVTTPSTSALDPWSDESVRKDQLADPEIKPIIKFK
ncbi:retrovirus-related Pol polyprotein from transposon 17.6 [Trichonephila clavipes]|nr:retrovirus-related Pol polyprotein from transposon 17.6 [Trichonephila clavipes]